MQYRYAFTQKAALEIEEFYMHVSFKYRHTYSLLDMERNIFQAYTAANLIEKTLLRRKPTLTRWQKPGWHMANKDKWYYAYTIDGDTITIQDACHAQNMHEETDNDK